MSETTVFNLGDIIVTVFTLGFAIIPIIIIFVTYKAFKRSEKRANEKLQLERENTVLLQKRIDDLNERLNVIEKMLKEVD
ncbi:hypothetical protein JFL43_04535 [Viridibacillus sp. YIM B01967]|uniref:Uncharacterized protein n=1 Tax=Viridibacillus soli TaxID=2798301 RepID=A0ABS1H4B2_9BACL|nr:hypothetical protein [Viridibacillus soli]MBK3494136.1 hypothetical protein [Viridibacillus soli]